MAAWGDGANWQEDDEAPARRPRRAPAKPNRQLVEIVVCPCCGSRDVQRHSTVGELSYWRCLACAERWKEDAAVGASRGHIA